MVGNIILSGHISSDLVLIGTCIQSRPFRASWCKRLKSFFLGDLEKRPITLVKIILKSIIDFKKN